MTRRAPKYLLLFLLSTNIFVFWPLSKISYEIPKVWFVNRIIEVIGVASLIFIFSLKKAIYDKRLIFLSLAFLLVVIISSITGADFNKSLFGNLYRGDGILTLLHFYILMFFLLLYFEKSWLASIFKTIGYTNFFLDIWIIFNFCISLYANPIFANWGGAMGVNFGNPNFLSGYLLVTLPFAHHLYEKGKSNILKTAFVLQIIAIFLTQAWSGILGSILYTLFIILNKHKNYKVGLITILIFLTTAGLYVSSYKGLYDNGKLVAESRGRIIAKGLLAFKQKPILGWGWANFDYAFESIDWPIKLNNDVYVDKAHSTLLEILVATGVVGFVIYLALLYKVGANLYSVKSKYSSYLFAVFILYVLHSQTNITSISEELIFWTLAGIATAYHLGGEIP